MGRPTSLYLVILALDRLDKGRGASTVEISTWLRNQGYDPPPPRSIAQICNTVPGIILQGRRRGAVARWFRGPLLPAALGQLGPSRGTPMPAPATLNPLLRAATPRARASVGMWGSAGTSFVGTHSPHGPQAA